MDATAWTVVGSAIAILVVIGASFRSLRNDVRAQVSDLRKQIEAQGEDLRKRIDAHGEQLGLLRERMAHLEGLREAITGKRVA